VSSSPAPQFGPNEWLVEEMYEQFLADPSSVDPAWHDFFADYKPTQRAVSQSAAATKARSANEAAAATATKPPPATSGPDGNGGLVNVPGDWREIQGTNGEILPPLVYSTELARSVKLAYATSVRVQLAPGTDDPMRTVNPADTQIKAQESGAKFRRLERTPFSTDLVYGLVNVRTDGVHILCATMEEQGTDFDVQVFKAVDAD